METIGYLFLNKKEKATEEESASAPNEVAVAKKPSKSLVHMANRSRDWTVASNAALAAAVKSFNSSHAGLPVMEEKSPSPSPVASARALFVPVLFSDDNAYGAKSALLWKLVRKSPDVALECAETNPLKNLIANDELQTKRGCMCAEAEKKNDMICQRGGAFHPNVQGAELYFRSITKEVENTWRLTGWAAK
jgi:hypothetical protein